MPVILRYNTTVTGSMIFAGNTLGLLGLFSPPDGNSTSINANGIGTFTSLNNLLQAPTYPLGTTFNWPQNGSNALVNLPPTATVLYAELCWSGSYFTAEQDATASINNSILFTTPSGSSLVTPDPLTAGTFTTNQGIKQYFRSANVSNLVSQTGFYSAQQVPGALGNSPNAAPVENNFLGWTLGIIYADPNLPYRNMTIWTAFEPVSPNSTVDVTISGFFSPVNGPITARLMISAGEGDPDVTGDIARFGPNAGSLTTLSGSNNDANNFFASQINNGDSQSLNVGLIDTNGTFGTVNQPHPTSTAGRLASGRMGYDITNVNGSSAMVNSQTSALIRFSTTGDGYLPNLLGLQIDEQEFDFGDAPDTSPGNGQGNYSTLLANNGPRHALVNNLKLGTQVTFEYDAYQNTDADGDDISKGIQDDGLISPRIIAVPSTTYTITVQYTNNIGSNANIYAWIDFNKDGIFQLEEAGTVVSVPSSITNPRSVSINFTVPATSNLTPGDITYLRIRITSNNLVNTNILPIQEDTRSLGVATDGEVEDYLLNAYNVDYGDAPDTSPGNGPNNYSTLLSNNGPRHGISNSLILGSFITTEIDAYQNPTATGDDLSKNIQDDAPITIISPIIAGNSTYNLPISYINNTGKPAFIYAWIDFNRNGIFELQEVNETTIVNSSNSNPNIINLLFNIPPGTTFVPGDTTFIRVRLTTDLLKNTNSLLTQEDTRSIGIANDGEVEDYMVNIIDLNINGVVFYDSNCNGLIDVGELRAQNVIIELYNVDNQTLPIKVTTTDISGNYSFTNLPSGTYFIKVVLPNGYSYTLSNVGTNSSINSNIDKGTGTSPNINLSANNTNVTVNSGLCKANKMAGNAFFDCNDDGILNFNEVFLCGVVFTLFNSNNQFITSTTTDCNGYYEFTDVPAGTYIIQVTAPQDMAFVTQNSSYYGSKPNNLGNFQITLTNSDYLQGFAGFTGTIGLKIKYCINCNNSTHICNASC